MGRFIPGTRVLTTLLAGVLHMRLRAVLAGVIPAVIIWVAAMTALGAFAGGSVARVLTQLDRYAVVAALVASAVLVVVAATRRLAPQGVVRRGRIPGQEQPLVAPQLRHL
jgi:membrane protein DedA with SNARE-associated domain